MIGGGEEGYSKNQEIKEINEYPKEIIINNKSGMVNNRQITDKETCIYYSDIILIELILNKFIIIELKLKCIDLIMQLINDSFNKIFENFNYLDFSNYPTANGDKGYNKYVNYFNILKRIYNDICNCFSKNQINEIIKDDLKNFLIKFPNHRKKRNY